jgi:hypothetical protein
LWGEIKSVEPSEIKNGMMLHDSWMGVGVH